MSLDPHNWSAARARMHDLLDSCLDSMQLIDRRATWVRPDDEVESLDNPARGDVPYAQLEHFIDQDGGNRSPMFFAYVQGGGTLAGLAADMVQSTANVSCGGRVHLAARVEQEVVRWSLELFGMDADTSSGVLTAGTSEAHVIAMAVLAKKIGRPPVVVCSSLAHESVERAIRLVGGTCVRVRTDGNPRVLANACVVHRADGLVCTLGDTLTHSVDNVRRIMAHFPVGYVELPWVHVDAAIGAHWLCNEQTARDLVDGLPHVNSVAFDFHKGFQVQYDCGAYLCRDQRDHLATFAYGDSAYLRRDVGGLASDGSVWPADLGIALSRQNRALRVWSTLRAYGAKAFGDLAVQQQQLGRYLAGLLASRVQWQVILEQRGVVLWRLVGDDRDGSYMVRIARTLQENGTCVITPATVDGQTVLRACIMNHRTEERHIERLVELLDQALVECMKQREVS